MNRRDKIAKYAYEKSVFYRDYVNWENLREETEFNFEKLPVICKDDIVDSHVPLQPVEYLLRDDEMTDNVIKMSTSGSTGKVLAIHWNKEDFLKSMTPLWFLRKKYYEINADDRMCYFYTIRRIGTEEMREFEEKNTLGFSKTSLNDERLKNIYERMLEYKPVWLLLQPSTAQMLLNTAKKHNFPPLDSLRYIELSGEMLTDGLRNRLTEFFGCRVANQYGSYEFNSIAYECPYGNMHVMSSNVYVEVMNENGEISEESEGEFVITSLMNRRNPFIRYRIGDKGRMSGRQNCPCGNHNPVIDLTVGRSHNYVECEDGTQVNAYIFPRAVDNINYLLDDVVKQFQVIQRGINDFLVRMYIDDRSMIQEIKEIFEENILDEALRNAEFEYCFENGYIEDEYGDKLMYFRSSFQK